MELFGNLEGLKAAQIKQLNRFYRRRCRPEEVISPGLARQLAQCSADCGRQLGLMVNRGGEVEMVIVGDSHAINIPSLHRYRLGRGRLRGLRCIHTRFEASGLNREDLTDLDMLRLDLMAVIAVDRAGLPATIEAAWLSSSEPQNKFQQTGVQPPDQLNIHCLELFQELESSAAESFAHQTADPDQPRAIIVSVGPEAAASRERTISEISELARAAGLVVVDSFSQQRRLDPHTAIGSGKLKEIIIASMAKDVDMLIFDHDLSPSQVNNLSRATELKVIDRTLLILDIFARRALSREGKLKVELAQLKYRLPRISEKTTALSRLTGGIGGRGPGETTLEIDRRRIRDRIAKLEKRLKKMACSRQTSRSRRKRNRLPQVSIIGYTNAGKSTLLNTMTKSRVFTENLPFATLDPTTRRLRLPQEREIIITDTVGFIQNLPQDLLDAFRTTLEELQEADLLLHVVDSSHPDCEEQIATVEQLLTELELKQIPCLLLANKIDLVDRETIAALRRANDAMPISARDPATLGQLLEAIDQRLRPFFSSRPQPVTEEETSSPDTTLSRHC